MAVKIGINGFGRIGRLVAREALSRNGVELVAVNDLFSAKDLAHLLKYDSIQGRYNQDVCATDNTIKVGSKCIKVTNEKDPAQLKWKDLGVDVVIESTGIFRTRAKAAAHLDAGAKKVIISAPSDSKDPADLTLVLGVNDAAYDASKHHVLSNASCTTNCLAPVAKVLLDKFGIVRGLMTTIHSYTADQRLVDAPHKDPRRARAAALNMVPTTTGAAKAVGLVLPELKGKMDGLSMRVPTATVSVVDLVVEVKKATTKEEVNAAIKAAAEGPLKGILAYTEEPLVSSDFIGCKASSVFDADCTYVIDGTMVKIFTWYDNEMGYSVRTVDLAEKIG